MHKSAADRLKEATRDGTSTNSITNPRNPENHGSEENNQEENIDETIDITLPDFADISNDFRDSSQDFDENNQENLKNPVNFMPNAATTVSTSEECPQFLAENAKNPDVTINLKSVDSPETSEDLILTENDVEKFVNLEDHNG